MRRAFVLLLLTVMVVAFPATAPAGPRWWGWIEELSGPGPYKSADWLGVLNSFTDIERRWCVTRKEGGRYGPVHTYGEFFSDVARAAQGRAFSAQRNDEALRRCRGTDDDVVAFLSSRLSTFASDQERQDRTRWGEGLLWKGETILYGRFRNQRVDIAVDVGTGLGFYWFHGRGPASPSGVGGEGYDVAKLMIPARVRFAPSDLVLFRVSKTRDFKRRLRAFYFEWGVDYLPGRITSEEFKSPIPYTSSGNWQSTHKFNVNIYTLLGL